MEPLCLTLIDKNQPYRDWQDADFVLWRAVAQVALAKVDRTEHQDQRCSICMTEIADMQDPCHLPCSARQVFCADCIYTPFEKHALECPLDKTDLFPVEELSLDLDTHLGRGVFEIFVHTFFGRADFVHQGVV